MIPGIVANQITEVPTSAPLIEDVSTTTIRYRVKNLDGVTATIYADHNLADPTTNRGSIAPDAYTTTVNTFISIILGGEATIYAKAQATGKSMSVVTSLYIYY